MAIQHYNALNKQVDIAGICFYEGEPVFHLWGGTFLPTCGGIRPGTKMHLGQWPSGLHSCRLCFGRDPVEPIKTETTEQDLAEIKEEIRLLREARDAPPAESDDGQG